jgi:hypothetical protein
MIEQHADQQCGHAVGDIDRPHHILVESQHVGEQGQQFWLVVEDAARQQLFTLGVQDHAVVMGLADVRTCPGLGHQSLRPFDDAPYSRTTSPAWSYSAIRPRTFAPPRGCPVTAGQR